MEQLLIEAINKLIVKGEIDKKITIDDVWSVSELDNYYYFRITPNGNYDNGMWRVNKNTKDVEYFDWLIYAFGDYKDGKSIGDLASNIFNKKPKTR